MGGVILEYPTKTACREAYNVGITRGLEEGEMNRALATARRMLEDGMPLTMVAKYSELPLETVQKLAEELRM